MALKHCKECGAEVSSSAKKCPKCGKNMTHPVLRGVLLAIFIIGVIGAVVSPNDETNTQTSTSTTQQQATSAITKENYDKIEKGMTEEQVKSMLGEPSSTSESEIPGVGTTILKHYQEPLSLKAIDVYFSNGKVYMKNWAEL